MTEAKRIYITSEFLEEFRNVLEHNYFNERAAYAEVIENGTILPAKKQTDEQGVSYFVGGVLDKNGIFIKTSEIERSSKSGSLTGGYEVNKQNIKHNNERVIYGGMLLNHFGHFLMESTSRLWYWTEHQDLSIAFLVARKKGIIQQFWEFMDLLGASKEKIHLITEPTHFKEIHIPTQAHTFVTRYDDKFLIPFRHIANRIGEIKSYDKIYLSRTKFKTGTPCYGEEIIEKIFRDNGFKTVYPEHLSLKEQITYIKGAQEIAGINGTATHLLVFANDNIKSIILERSDEAMPEQAIVNQAIKADWYNIGVNMNPFPVKHSAGPILLGVTKELAAFCDNHYMHVAPNYLNYVSNKNSKHFIKNYMEIYTYITKNRELYAKYPVLADRLLNMSNAYLPLKKKIKQKIKEWKKQL